MYKQNWVYVQISYMKGVISLFNKIDNLHIYTQKIVLNDLPSYIRWK